MVTRKDFVRKLSENTGYTQSDISTVLDGAFDLIIQSVKNHDVVKPHKGFTFEGKTVPAYMGRNPSTGESIQIPAKTKIALHVSQSVKDAIQ